MLSLVHRNQVSHIATMDEVDLLLGTHACPESHAETPDTVHGQVLVPVADSSGAAARQEDDDTDGDEAPPPFDEALTLLPVGKSHSLAMRNGKRRGDLI